MLNYFKNLIDNYNDGTNFNGAINTNIYNNNTLGEIRFITSNAPSYFGGNYKFITKIITEDGIYSPQELKSIYL